MLLALILLFTVLPMVELWVLLQIGGAWGVGPTIALVLFTGVLGAALARWQGFRTLWRIRSELASGRPPTDALLDGALILVAGAVLVTPGVITDAIGFALLAPPTRAVVKRGLRAWFARAVKQGKATGSFRFTTFGPSHRAQAPPDSRVIDVEVTEVRSHTP